MEVIKAILFGSALVILLFNIFRKKYFNAQERKHLISLFIITLIIFFIIILSVHHLLRLEFGITDTITYLTVLVVIVYHTLKFKAIILNSNYVLLILSLVLLASAVILDLITDARAVHFFTSGLIEEILRILGAMFWLFYSLKPGLNKSITDVGQ